MMLTAYIHKINLSVDLVSKDQPTSISVADITSCGEIFPASLVSLSKVVDTTTAIEFFAMR
jgi:hypothetical protein